MTTLSEVDARYPLHAKVATERDTCHVLSDFLDYLEGESLLIATFDGDYEDDLIPARISNNELIGGFIGVDAKAFAAEKEAMYQELVASNNKTVG